MANILTEQIQVPCTSITLTLKAEGLKNKDILSKSDPICVVSVYKGRLTGRGEWFELGRTECIQNSLNPEWAKTLTMDYYFEERQTLKFDVYDVDSNSPKVEDHDFLGTVQCDLAEIVGSGTFCRKLGGLRGDCGVLCVVAEEVTAGSRENVFFQLRGSHLDKKDFFGKSDPFLLFYRLEHNTRRLAHRTEYIKKTLNPTWKQFEVNAKLLCGGDHTKDFEIECWDYNLSGSHTFIGSCRVSIEKLLSKEATSIPLINIDKKSRKGDKYKNSGELLVDNVQIIKQHTFLDFIGGGTQLDFSVAIDFTASNGRVTSPESLHYISPHAPNQYEVAVRAVIDICQHYNNSKTFDVYGFGAKIPPSHVNAPVFNCNFSPSPSVIGVSGVMAAYREALNRVSLFGPTNFAPVINEVAKKAAQITQSSARYQVLLIITDGVISDMANTKYAIINASALPMSIIIVGVGNDEFDSMVELDSDDHLLSHAGRTAQRDIVQFVPLRQFLVPGSTAAASEQAMALLAKEVLAEVPLQLTSFMKSRGYAPRSPSDPWPRDAEATIASASSAPYYSSGYAAVAVNAIYGGKANPYPQSPSPQPPPYPSSPTPTPQFPHLYPGQAGPYPPQGQPQYLQQGQQQYNPYGGQQPPPEGYIQQPMVAQAPPMNASAPPIDYSSIQPQFINSVP